VLIGQTCKLNQNGRMESPTGNANPASGKFAVDNQYTADMNIGVTCKLSVSGGEAIPGAVDGAFYVTPKKVPHNYTVDMTPIDKVVIWFQTGASTGSMIAKISGPTFEVNFTGENPKSQKIVYNKDGNWQKGVL
jgi:hypothetical protein